VKYRVLFDEVELKSLRLDKYDNSVSSLRLIISKEPSDSAGIANDGTTTRVKRKTHRYMCTG